MQQEKGWWLVTTSGQVQQMQEDLKLVLQNLHQTRQARQAKSFSARDGCLSLLLQSSGPSAILIEITKEAKLQKAHSLKLLHECEGNSYKSDVLCNQRAELVALIVLNRGQRNSDD